MSTMSQVLQLPPPPHRRKIDFTISGRMSKHLEIIAEIWKVFFEKGLETKKRVFLTGELDDSAQQQIRDIIENRGGELVSKEDEASHIVYGFPPKSAAPEGM